MSLNTKLLEPQVIDYVKRHEKKDIPELILKGSPLDVVNIQQIAQQIKGKQVAKTKFPNLYVNDDIIYPPHLNLEQSSSELAASYKAKFVAPNECIIDITGGMGIDALAFAERSKHVTYCEIQPELFEYARHNLKAINSNIELHQTDGIEFLKECKTKYDWIYVDPARRNKHQQKIFRLEDSTPNVVEHLDFFQTKSNRILIKASPLLDLKYSLNKLKYINEIHIVAIKNEVKEVLIFIDFSKPEAIPKLKALNLSTGQDHFESDSTNLDKTPLFSKPKTYLYEPNAAIMKSQLYGELSLRFELFALAQNTHLFTGDELIDFPGRIFEIKSIISPNKKLIKKHLQGSKTNISSRNYPLKPKEIKAKYNLQDGGDSYTFFTTDFNNQKIVLICHKIK